MGSPVYSFYDYDKQLFERLRDHVKHALESFSEDSKLIRYGNSLRKTFYDMLKYAIILHDFGKVSFNQAMLRFNKGIKKVGFEGHEVLSAWFADKYLEHVEDEGLLGYGDGKYIVLSILLHHHPMDLRDRAEKLREKKYICVNNETLTLFYNELREVFDLTRPISLESAVCAPEIVNGVLGPYNSIFRTYWSDIWMNGKPAERKVFLLLTQGLIAADYRSASVTRGEGISEFAETVRAYLKYYGVSHFAGSK